MCTMVANWVWRCFLRAYSYSKEASGNGGYRQPRLFEVCCRRETFLKLPSIWDMISFGRYGCRRLSSGRKIGFPTANLRVSDSGQADSPAMVYAVRVCVEGKEYGGMLSIGYRPTLENGPDRSIEVHIFRFDADIYQQPMRLSFVRRTRPELKFDSIEELIAQLHRDEVEIKSILLYKHKKR